MYAPTPPFAPSAARAGLQHSALCATKQPSNQPTKATTHLDQLLVGHGAQQERQPIGRNLLVVVQLVVAAVGLPGRPREVKHRLGLGGLPTRAAGGLAHHGAAVRGRGRRSSSSGRSGLLGEPPCSGSRCLHKVIIVVVIVAAASLLTLALLLLCLCRNTVWGGRSGGGAAPAWRRCRHLAAAARALYEQLGTGPPGTLRAAVAELPVAAAVAVRVGHCGVAGAIHCGKQPRLRRRLPGLIGGCAAGAKPDVRRLRVAGAAARPAEELP